MFLETFAIVSLRVSLRILIFCNISRESWPLDGVKFDTLKEQHDKRNPEDFEIDYGVSFMLKSISLASWALQNCYLSIQIAGALSKAYHCVRYHIN